MHNLYISGICRIFWNVLCFVFCFTQFSIGIICIYLEYVKYYGMFFVFFHGLHNVPFYRGKTGHSNGKSWANHHLEEHHLANGDVSMQRNTFLEGKNIHRMGNHSLAPHFMPLYAWNMRNILECSMFLVLCFYIPKRSPLPFPLLKG